MRAASTVRVPFFPMLEKGGGRVDYDAFEYVPSWLIRLFALRDFNEMPSSTVNGKGVDCEERLVLSVFREFELCFRRECRLSGFIKGWICEKLEVSMSELSSTRTTYVKSSPCTIDTKLNRLFSNTNRPMTVYCKKYKLT